MENKKDGFHNNETACSDRYDILKDFSKDLRSHQTFAEKLLWERLRGKQLGVTFRRQHPVLDFIADFICLPSKLIIEIDGGYHTTIQQSEDDRLRDERLAKMGYRTLRFTNDQVLSSIDEVLTIIKENL